MFSLKSCETNHWIPCVTCRVYEPIDIDPNVPRQPRAPKRKVAVMIGYCGTGYHGMQFNPPRLTIEEDLFKGFVRAGAVSQDNAHDLKKVAFQRAARTDKGVHAAGNVVSLKLIIEDPDIVKKINDNLPDQIRVWGISRTNKAFECRRMCSSRIYEYLIPSYSFLPPKPESALAKRLQEAKTKYPGIVRDDTEGMEYWTDIKRKQKDFGISQVDVETVQKNYEDRQEEYMKRNQQKMLEERERAQKRREAIANGEPFIEVKQEPDAAKYQEVDLVVSDIEKKIRDIEYESQRNYRISPSRFELVSEIFKQYEGSHNFHNFTIQKTFEDPSALRYMKSIEVSEPKIIEGTEWISIKLHGQSFMMHQIRKMVSMAALIVRCGCPVSLMDKAFGSKQMNIPKAPGLGLLLEQPVFGGVNTKLTGLGHDPISFEKWQNEIDDFKMKHIYKKIYDEEKSMHVFSNFFDYVDGFRDSSAFGYLVPGEVDKPTGEYYTTN